MRKIKSLIPALAAFALLCFIAWSLGYLVKGVWQELVSVNPQLAVGVVAAATTLLATTLTVMLGRYMERKKEVEAHFRAEKIKIYDEFLSELFRMFAESERSKGETSGEDNSMVQFLRLWQQKLLLWGGSGVLETYFKWINRLKTGRLDAQAIFLMDDFFRALRKDIGQSSAGLKKGVFCNLVLRHGEFFLEQAARNPNITLEELADLEKTYFESRH